RPAPGGGGGGRRRPPPSRGVGAAQRRTGGSPSGRGGRISAKKRPPPPGAITTPPMAPMFAAFENSTHRVGSPSTIPKISDSAATQTLWVHTCAANEVAAYWE